MPSFASSLIAWQREHGRHGLPWQGAGAYRVWLSEIMLQQTQVATVIPYYQRFIASFPTIAALAAASEEQVLAHWSGLGYYARGRNLHRAAQIVEKLHGGEFPCQFDQLLVLPGIGRSTAAAICALAFQQRHAILDGNVKRVLARYCGISGSPAGKSVEQLLWQHAEALLPERDVAAYTQAMMDMGATLCTRSRPQCVSCPVQHGCVAHQTGRVAELPTPRLRKVVPERHATFLLAMHGRKILLERRDSTGIWGGLWCMPQLEEGDGTLADYAQRSGWQIDEQVALPVFTHVFTHFKLHITPLLLNLAGKPLKLQQSGSQWLDVDEALRAAIPAPVRRLLAGILSSKQ
ncbi:MAG: A/G-specific adenine glycosylase [Gallionella sp.]|nr:A/G-specific adenine glycosylase [Gallionella sp.]